MDLLFLQRRVVAEQGGGGDAAGAGAKHAQVLAAGHVQYHVDGFLEGVDVGTQPPLTMALGRVAPADHEALHMVADQVAGQALVG